jgi:hypothetical protein
MRQVERGLIPPPGEVREQLARNYGQARLLRRLLKLSEDAAVEINQRCRDEGRSRIEGVWPGRTAK